MAVSFLLECAELSSLPEPVTKAQQEGNRNISIILLPRDRTWLLVKTLVLVQRWALSKDIVNIVHWSPKAGNLGYVEFLGEVPKAYYFLKYFDIFILETSHILG